MYDKGYVKKIGTDGQTVELLDSGLGETVAVDVDEEGWLRLLTACTSKTHGAYVEIAVLTN